MPQERLPMRKIREVLRLSANGLSKRKIAASLGLSATAVGDCIRRARLAGVAWPPAAELSDAALEQLLYWSVAAAEKRRPQPEWAIIHRELKRAGVTLQLLWEEYRAAHPDAHGYRQSGSGRAISWCHSLAPGRSILGRQPACIPCPLAWRCGFWCRSTPSYW